MVPRPAIGWLILAIAAMCALGAGGCHRRRARNGACTAHIDCDPGYDCRDGLCVKRPPVPGTEAARLPTPPPPAPERPAPPSQAAPPPPATDEAPAPKPKAPPPPPPNYAPPLDPTLPLWKARLKNS